MNTNKVADAILNTLSIIHPRVYRNAPPLNPLFPYIIFDCDIVSDSTPSDDYYVYITVFDLPTASIRTMNDLADRVEELDETTINDVNLNLYLTRISRQFVSNNELISSKAINLQMNARVYWK